MKLLKIVDSRANGKRYTAYFSVGEDNKLKKVHFGSATGENYTMHKDEDKKKAYIARHKVNEDWNNPMSAGALSRWILWNKKTIGQSKKDFVKRFNL